MQRQTQLANELWPLILARVNAYMRSSNGLGGGAAVTLSEHELGGALHKGVLRDDQGPQFLLASGGRALAGNLAVNAGVTVDGIDISAHAADPDAHHPKQHVLATDTALGTDHTISGGVAGHVLKATAAAAARFAQLMVPELGASGASWDVAALTATNTVGLRTPSSDVVSGAAEALLKSSAAGALALRELAIGVAMTLYDTEAVATGPDIQFNTNALLAAQGSIYFALDSDDNATGAALVIGHDGDNITDYTELFRFTDNGRLGIGDPSPSYPLDVVGTARMTTSLLTPLLSTVSGNLTAAPVGDLRLNPGSVLVKLMSGVMLQSDNYVSQLTGVRVSHAGEGDFRYLYADELHAKAFIADLEQALAGGQIITKSVTMLASNFTAPAAGGIATLHVKDLPSAQGMQVFQEGDIVRIRQFSRAGGGLAITNCWGAVTNPVDVMDGSQIWTFTRSTAPNAGAMTAGSVIFKDSIILDYGVSGNGFYEVNAIDGLHAMNSPYLQFVRWEGHPATGQQLRIRLGQLRGVFGVDEFGLFVGTGVTDGDRWLHLSDVAGQNGINNLPIKMFAAGVNTGIWNADGTLYLGFDGIATQAERDFSVATDFVRIGRSSDTNPNIYWSATGGALAIRSGTSSKIIFESDGDSYFAGVMTIGAAGEVRQGTGSLGTDYTGLRIWRQSNVGRIAGYNNDTIQWSADTTGKLSFGGGNGLADALGIVLKPTTGLTDVPSSILAWYDTPASRTGFAARIAAGAFDLVGNRSGIVLEIAGSATGGTSPGLWFRENGAWRSVYHSGNMTWPADGLLKTAAATLAARNAASSTYVPFAAQQIGVENGYITSPATFQFWRSDGAALQAIWAASLLVTPDQATDSSRLAANGIYARGGLRGGNGTGWSASYMLEVVGEGHITGALRSDRAFLMLPIANPGASSSHGVLFVDTNDANKLKYIKPNGATYTIVG